MVVVGFVAGSSMTMAILAGVFFRGDIVFFEQEQETCYDFSFDSAYCTIRDSYRTFGWLT